MSDRRELRDASGRLLGTESRNSSGRTELRDAGGRLLGSHDTRSDHVRDAAGRLVGRGAGVLGSLLPPRRDR